MMVRLLDVAKGACVDTAAKIATLKPHIPDLHPVFLVGA
jgi:hypothetical protein